jgi:hypothetical protein
MQTYTNLNTHIHTNDDDDDRADDDADDSDCMLRYDSVGIWSIRDGSAARMSPFPLVLHSNYREIYYRAHL